LQQLLPAKNTKTDCIEGIFGYIIVKGITSCWNCLTFSAPGIVEAQHYGQSLLLGRQAKKLQASSLMKSAKPPSEWKLLLIF
jgi:hypothetical protein